MGGRAAVWLTGTVTMPGDLMDDVVLAALGKPGRGPDRGAWLGAERIRCHYHPVDWPDRFDPAELAALRAADLHTYALTYEPHLLGTVAAGRRFTRDLWRRDLRFPTVRRIISVDHATEQGPASDMTAIAVLGVDAAGQADPGRGRVCVEHVELGRYDIPALRERLFTICESFPRVKPDVVLWERNQGGRMLATSCCRCRRAARRAPRTAPRGCGRGGPRPGRRPGSRPCTPRPRVPRCGWGTPRMGGCPRSRGRRRRGRPRRPGMTRWMRWPRGSGICAPGIRRCDPPLR
jgi:hypothetical protein